MDHIFNMLPENALRCSAFIGCIVVVSVTLKTFRRLYRFYEGHYTGPTVNFKDLGKYAVVTGATDGIGKAYAFELARYGMSIVLISRTLSKLEATAKELKAEFPGIDVKIIVADYEKTDIYERIEIELANIDVGVLVNNVGAAIRPMALLSETSRQDLFRTFNLNMISVVMTSHICISKMAAKRRGAVLNISSASAVFPPLYLMYATSKAYVSRFSYGLRLQYKPMGIIIQDVQPFFVSTKLAEGISGIHVVSAEQCARQSLKTVGHYDETHGAVIHDILGFLLSFVSEARFCRIMKPYNKQMQSNNRKDK